MSNRVLSVHQEHELLLKLEQAGLSEIDAQDIIESKGNALARELIGVIRGNKVDGDWFSFTTSGVTLNELREQNPNLFSQEPNPWWKNEPFANSMGLFRKLSLRTSAQPDLFGMDWDEQQKLLASDEEVSTVRDLVQGTIIRYHRYHTYDKWPLWNYWVSTSDISSSGARIHVRFDSDGLCIYADRAENLGLSVVRNLSSLRACAS